MISIESKSHGAGMQFGNIDLLRTGDDWTVMYQVNGFWMQFNTDDLREAGRVVEKAKAGKISRGELLWHIMRRNKGTEEGARAFARANVKVDIRGKLRKVGKRSCSGCLERSIHAGYRCSDGIVWLCERCLPYVKRSHPVMGKPTMAQVMMEFIPLQD